MFNLIPFSSLSEPFIEIMLQPNSKAADKGIPYIVDCRTPAFYPDLGHVEHDLRTEEMKV